jgi:hypothetical protein
MNFSRGWRVCPRHIALLILYAYLVAGYSRWIVSADAAIGKVLIKQRRLCCCTAALRGHASRPELHMNVRSPPEAQLRQRRTLPASSLRIPLPRA